MRNVATRVGGGDPRHPLRGEKTTGAGGTKKKKSLLSRKGRDLRGEKDR